jgi:hypothetical protein
MSAPWARVIREAMHRVRRSLPLKFAFPANKHSVTDVVGRILAFAIRASYPDSMPACIHAIEELSSASPRID